MTSVDHYIRMAIFLGKAFPKNPEIQYGYHQIEKYLKKIKDTSQCVDRMKEELGGSVSLTLGGLLITGVLASLFVDWCTRWLKITDDRIVGFALGLNGHAIGTARAFEISHTAGAFASLGMGLTGVFTALFLPLAFLLF